MSLASEEDRSSIQSSKDTSSPNLSSLADDDIDWMVRPCEWYQEEFKDCTSVRGRFQQYFVHGRTEDCQQWKTDYNNCCLYKRKKDNNALEAILASERQRIQGRLHSTLNNNIWTLRDSPPTDFNSPLPDWLVEKQKGSLFHKVMEENTTSKRTYCVVM